MLTTAFRRYYAFICIPFIVAAPTLVGCSSPVLTSVGGTDQGVCPADWEHRDGHCYRLTTSVGPWNTAEAEAVAAGGHLVTVNDEDEQLWLNETFRAGQGSMWIGLYQQPGSTEPDSDWLWISQEAVTYTHWADGEPDEAPPVETNEDRAVMNAFALGRWMDVPEAAYYVGLMEVPSLEPGGNGNDNGDGNDNDNDNGNDNGKGDDGGNGTATSWFESWEIAPPGPKEHRQVFEADTGPWVARKLVEGGLLGSQSEPLVAANGSWTGGEVSILDDGRLFIRSHAAHLGLSRESIGAASAAKIPFAPTESSDFLAFPVLPRLLVDQIGFPLTRDTTFSGVLDCETHDLDTPEHIRYSYVTIQLAVGLSVEAMPYASVRFVHILLHETSVLYLAARGETVRFFG